MTVIRLAGMAALLAGLCCSCQTSARYPLPPETSFNSDAGHRKVLYVKVRIQDRKDLLFMIDTGMPFSVVDKSLEPILGKCVYTHKMPLIWYPDLEFHTYRDPGLFIGDARLKIGAWLRAGDLGLFIQKPRDAKEKVSGILGLDCLRNYCLQMDFVTHRLRFLDPNGLNAKSADLGRAFPLVYFNGRMCINATLLDGKKAKSMIDTGDPNDFILTHGLFEKTCQVQKGARVAHFTTPRGTMVGVASLPRGFFAGEPYDDLVVGESPEGTNLEVNILGMRFLARHLVTLNIPKGVLYLKP